MGACRTLASKPPPTRPTTKAARVLSVLCNIVSLYGEADEADEADGVVRAWIGSLEYKSAPATPTPSIGVLVD